MFLFEIPSTSTSSFGAQRQDTDEVHGYFYGEEVYYTDDEQCAQPSHSSDSFTLAQPIEITNKEEKPFRGILSSLTKLNDLKPKMTEREFFSFKEELTRGNRSLHKAIEGRKAFEIFEQVQTNTEHCWSSGRVFNNEDTNPFTGELNESFMPLEFLVLKKLPKHQMKTELGPDTKKLQAKFDSCRVNYSAKKFLRSGNNISEHKGPLSKARKGWAELATERWILTNIRMTDARRKTHKTLKKLLDNWDSEPNNVEILEKIFETYLLQESQIERMSAFTNIALDNEVISAATKKKQREDFVNHMIDNNLEPWGEKYEKDLPSLGKQERTVLTTNLNNALPKDTAKNIPRKMNMNSKGKNKYKTPSRNYSFNDTHAKNFHPYKGPGKNGKKKSRGKHGQQQGKNENRNSGKKNFKHKAKKHNKNAQRKNNGRQRKRK